MMAKPRDPKTQGLIEQLNIDISQLCPYAKSLLYGGILADRIVLGDVLRHSDTCPMCASSLREGLRHVKLMHIFSLLKELLP
jgi:hypothetical protein